MFQKIKDIYKSLKQKWLWSVIKPFVEDVPVLKKVWGFVDGHKTQIGRGGFFVSALLVLVQQHFPEVPYIEDVNGYYAAVFSWLLTELGLQHSEIKEVEAEKEAAKEAPVSA